MKTKRIPASALQFAAKSVVLVGVANVPAFEPMTLVAAGCLPRVDFREIRAHLAACASRRQAQDAGIT